MSSGASLKFVVEGDPTPAVKAMQKVTGEAKKSSTSIGASFKKLAGVGAGLAGVAGLTSFFKSSMAEAEEAQKVAGQTAAVIESTGAAANVTAGHVDDLANSISKYAGIDDEAIASGENMLLTFTNIKNEIGKGNDVFDQATKVMTDMSVAMGTDMKGQAIQLGKALNDPIKGVGALADVGVAFTEQQRKQIAAMVENNDTMGAQKLILAELSKEFGGSAAAQATASDKMKVALGNLEEEVGQALLPVIEGLANFLTDDVIPAFSAVVGWVKDNQTTVKILAGTVAGLWAAYKGYKILTAVGAAVSLATAKYAQFVAQMSYGNRVQRTASSGLQNLGKIAVGAAVVVALVAKAWTDNAAKQARAKAEMQALTDAITADNGAVGDNTREVQANKLEQAGIYEIAQRAGIGLNLVTDAALGNTDAQKKLRAQLGPAAAELKISGSEAQKLGVFALAMGGQIDTASASAARLNSVTGKTADSQKDAAGAIKDTGVQASTTKDAIDKLKSAFDELNGKTIDAAEAEIAWQDSLTAVTKELKGHNTELSLDTKKGRDHLQVVFDSIKAAQDDAEATLQRTNSSKKARAAFQTDIGTLKQHMIALGFDKGKVQDLIAEYGKTPKFKVTKFDAQTAAAKQKANDLQAQVDALRRGVIIPVRIDQSGTFHVPGSGLRGQASGTSSAPAGWSWVGERGPELMSFRGGERVLSHPQSMRVSRGYAGGTGGTTMPGPQRVTGRMRLEVDGRGGLWALLDGVVDDKVEHRRTVIGMDH
jgi:hypothetical protein